MVIFINVVREMHRSAYNFPRSFLYKRVADAF